MRVAVFDLGTNVFNLLIARISEKGYKMEKVIKVPSNMGKTGLSSFRLSEDAIESSLQALGEMVPAMADFDKADMIRAVATSAVRDADNKNEFIERIKECFGIEVEVISGDREAELIYKGIRDSIFIYDENVLMLDIGGGSCEFIVANGAEMLWKGSYPIGVARLKEMICPSDPITCEEISRLNAILDNSLASAKKEIAMFAPGLLIGSSGSFDTIRDLICPNDDGSLPAMELALPEFRKLHEKLLKSCRAERLVMPRMPEIRVDYMVLGCGLVNYVVNTFGIDEMFQSSYSLKEGYMAELADGNV